MPFTVTDEALSPSQGIVGCAFVKLVGASLKPQTLNQPLGRA